MEVIGVSIDSQFSHNAWRNTKVEDGGIGQVKYPLIADVKHEICKAYDVEHPEAGVAFRGSFLIDKNGVVRHQVVNDLPLGRNIDEMLRMVDALQFHEEHGEVCPAQWEKGKKVCKPLRTALPSTCPRTLTPCNRVALSLKNRRLGAGFFIPEIYPSPDIAALFSFHRSIAIPSSRLLAYSSFRNEVLIRMAGWGICRQTIAIKKARHRRA